jgi:hypothetical protein
MSTICRLLMSTDCFSRIVSLFLTAARLLRL